MKKTSVIALALAAVCIMPSCEKDPKPSDEPSIEPTAEMIVFGNHTYMDVVTYNHVDWEYHENDYFTGKISTLMETGNLILPYAHEK